MSEKIDCFGATEIGSVCETNQDHFVIADLRKSMQVHQSSLSMEDRSRLYGATQGQLLLVADGQSGDPNVGRGSTVAVDALSNYLLSSLPWYFRLEGKSKESFAKDLVAAVEHCQAEVDRMGMLAGEDNLESALTVAYITWPHVFLLHLGSSRCYLGRGGKLIPLTSPTNDSPFQRVVSDGGKARPSGVVASTGELVSGDGLLLCTDGIHSVLTHEHLEKRFAENIPAEAIASNLIADATASSGQDSMTAVVSRFGASDAIIAQAEAVADRSDAAPSKESAATENDSAKHDGEATDEQLAPV